MQTSARPLGCRARYVDDVCLFGGPSYISVLWALIVFRARSYISALWALIVFRARHLSRRACC